MERTVRLSPRWLFNSDPTCRQIKDRFWVFSTHDQSSPRYVSPDDTWKNMHDYHAWSTANLIDWIYHGSLFCAADIPWARGGTIWDGDAGIEAPDGAYIAYVPVSNDIVGTWEIAVLEASSPGGPYREVGGAPLLTNDTLFAAGYADVPASVCLSPTVVHDDHGLPHLLFGQFRVFAVPLDKSMRQIAGSPFEVEVPLRGGSATEYIEGPMIHRVGNRWVFSYMTYKDWDGPNDFFEASDPFGPYVQACRAEEIWGPYRNPVHWIYPVAPDGCNNQHALAQFNQKWIVCYHIPYDGTEHRHVIVREIDGPDPFAHPIYPAKDLRQQDTVDASIVVQARGTRLWAADASTWNHARIVDGVARDHALELAQGGSFAFFDVVIPKDVATLAIALPERMATGASLHLHYDVGRVQLPPTLRVTLDEAAEVLRPHLSEGPWSVLHREFSSDELAHFGGHRVTLEVAARSPFTVSWIRFEGRP